jgi:hypothetical protein
VAVLHLQEAREARAQAHGVGVGGVDAGDERFRQALEHLASESAPHERGERLVAVGPVVAGGEHEVGEGPQLPRPAEEVRGEETR